MPYHPESQLFALYLLRQALPQKRSPLAEALNVHQQQPRPMGWQMRHQSWGPRLHRSEAKMFIMYLLQQYMPWHLRQNRPPLEKALNVQQLHPMGWQMRHQSWNPSLHRSEVPQCTACATMHCLLTLKPMVHVGPSLRNEAALRAFQGFFLSTRFAASEIANHIRVRDCKSHVGEEYRVVHLLHRDQDVSDLLLVCSFCALSGLWSCTTPSMCASQALLDSHAFPPCVQPN